MFEPHKGINNTLLSCVTFPLGWVRVGCISAQETSLDSPAMPFILKNPTFEFWPQSMPPVNSLETLHSQEQEKKEKKPQ